MVEVYFGIEDVEYFGIIGQLRSKKDNRDEGKQWEQ